MMRKHDDSYDVVVIGAGVAGEICAHRVRAGGLRVALIDRRGVGGEAATWEEIPSTSLLGPANARWQAEASAGIASPAVALPRRKSTHDQITRQGIEKRRIARLEREGIVFLRGDAHIVAPGQIEVLSGREDQRQLLATRNVVIATGSTQRRPEIVGLEEVGYWTTREASVRAAQPTTMVVLDGSMWAVELAQVFRHYGSEVTLITDRDQLVPHEDPEAGELLARHFQQSGIRLLLGRRAIRVEREESGTRRVTLDDNSRVRGEEILVAGSRLPRTEALGLEYTDVHVTDTGIQVDEYCRAGEGIWAIGDVTGVALRSHIALYQARLAADDLLGHSHPAHYETVPRIVFTDPQVAATGLTRAEAQARHIDVASATLELLEPSFRTGTNASPVRGRLTLHADRAQRVLLGAWAVAPDAGEWIHLAVLAIRAGVPLAVLRDTVEQFPPFSEGFLQALDQLTSDRP
jgi:dihydrolipoamide dehydrogenase